MSENENELLDDGILNEIEVLDTELIDVTYFRGVCLILGAIVGLGFFFKTTIFPFIFLEVLGIILVARSKVSFGSKKWIFVVTIGFWPILLLLHYIGFL